MIHINMKKQEIYTQKNKSQLNSRNVQLELPRKRVESISVTSEGDNIAYFPKQMNYKRIL